MIIFRNFPKSVLYNHTSQHPFQHLNSLGDILREMLMVAQEVGTATTDGIIQIRTHFVGIGGNGHLDVILLPVECGMHIDALLLMQEAIGGLYTVFCNHRVAVS